MLVAGPAQSPEGSQAKLISTLRYWYALASLFSTAKTAAEDRLVALSGVANMLDPYFIGHEVVGRRFFERLWVMD